jgi:hypothetical protein
MSGLGVSPFHHIYHHNKLKERYHYLERIPVAPVRDQSKKGHVLQRRNRNMLRLGTPTSVEGKLKSLLHISDFTQPLADGSSASAFCMEMIHCYWSDFKRC